MHEFALNASTTLCDVDATMVILRIAHIARAVGTRIEHTASTKPCGT